MRKLLLLIVLLLSTLCHAQQADKWEQVKSVNFYGVDYSLVKTFGVTESTADLVNAFLRINELFQSEADKYAVAKWIPKPVSKFAIEVANEVNSHIGAESLSVSDTKHELTEEQVTAAVRNLPVKETEGTGMVVLAKMLNKPAQRGYYKVVFFDIASRRILLEGDTEGKVGGFGLRNYWARSIYEALKCLKGSKFTLYMKEPEQ